MTDVTFLEGDVLKTLKDLADCSVQCVVTSPPYYGLRDYGTAEWKGDDPNCNHVDDDKVAERKRQKKSMIAVGESLDGSTRTREHDESIGKDWQYRDACKKCGALRIDSQIGLEPTPEAFVEKLVDVFRECRRVLKNDGTLWLNLGDSYWGGKGQSGTRGEDNQEIRYEKGASINRGYQTLGGAGLTRPTDSKHPVIKPKDLIGIPWMVAFALRADGWYLRQDIIWAKPNPMPESVTDRCTKSHEYLFVLSKSAQYYYDFEAILEPANFDGRKATKMKGSWKYQNGFAPTDDNPNTLHIKGHERWSRQMPGIGPKHGAERNRGEEYKPIRGYKTKAQLPDMQHHGDAIQSGYGLSGNGFKGHSGNYDSDGNLLGHEIDGVPARNKRDVWFVPTKPYKEAHFATFPPDLIEPCILAGSKEGDTVLDPFGGSGTTAAVAIKRHRKAILCELNPKYIKIAKKRLSTVQYVMPETIEER